ncbi:MAG: hypothetical protein AAB466_13405 [Verrucomicrobiota bacterium]
MAKKQPRFVIQGNPEKRLKQSAPIARGSSKHSVRPHGGARGLMPSLSGQKPYRQSFLFLACRERAGGPASQAGFDEGKKREKEGLPTQKAEINLSPLLDSRVEQTAGGTEWFPSSQLRIKLCQ